MSDQTIYQRIIDVDVTSSSGLPALQPGEPRDPAVGYVVVNEVEVGTAGARLLPDVVIPDSKRRSYDLARALFDHYNLAGDEVDVITRAELAERDALLDFVVSTPPMQLARQWISARRPSVAPLSDAEWRARVQETWFRSFQSRGGDPTRSGFEHVFLGEWNTARDIVGGFHWWYFYYTEANQGDIVYKGARYGNRDAAAGITIPEIATLAFDWEVENDTQVLDKRVGGFFVGPSVEGLMALGMVRAAYDTTPEPPRNVPIAGMQVDLALYTSPDRRAINTFYPIVQRVLSGTSFTPPSPAPPPAPTQTPAPAPPTSTAQNGSNGTAAATADLGVRIISVMPNPAGSTDTGREAVTIINMFGDDIASLAGWRVHAPNDSALVFGDIPLPRGAAVTATARSLALSNKGGRIQLKTPDGAVQHTVQYDRSTARVQGGVLMWNMQDDLVLVDQQ